MLLPDNFEGGNFLVKMMCLWQVYTQLTLSAVPALCRNEPEHLIP